MTCERCGTETNVHTMSMFNTQDICMDCKDKETKHPDYQKAAAMPRLRPARRGTSTSRALASQQTCESRISRFWSGRGLAARPS